MRCGFCFFLKDELTGRNAHAGLEQPRKVADMISGSLCHLLYRDLLVQMCFHISDGIGKGRVKALGDKGNTVWRTAFQIVMLMYSKEANNRKQEIDRQHRPIPNQRANDKHHGNVYNLLFRYGKVRSQNMEKLKSSFPTFCKRTFPQLHKIASYAHYAQCRLLRKPSHFIIYSRK